MEGQWKILMISDHSDPLAKLGGEESGGQNVYVHELSSRLAQKGHTVHVVTRQNDPDQPKKEKSPGGYTVFRIPLGPEGFMPKEEFEKYLPSFKKQVTDLVSKEGYDIMHSHYWLSGVAGVAARTKFCIPLVHTFHSLGKVKHRALRGISPTHMHRREEYEEQIVRRADCTKSRLLTCRELGRTKGSDQAI